jgi:DNA-binding NarL/FixJ family response regulator
LIRELREDWPELLMLVVSMHDESLHAERVLRAGARGYITKQQATRSILQAIRQVLAGSIYLNEAIAKDVLSRLTRPTKSIEVGGLSPADLLADREMQVFELTGRGLNTRQIADRLNVGVKTIETYRHRIREKLKVDDPAKLLQLAIAWSHRLDCRPDSSP